MYYVMRASVPSLHRESTDSLMIMCTQYVHVGIRHTSQRPCGLCEVLSVWRCLGEEGGSSEEDVGK